MGRNRAVIATLLVIFAHGPKLRADFASLEELLRRTVDIILVRRTRSQHSAKLAVPRIAFACPTRAPTCNFLSNHPAIPRFNQLDRRV